MIQKPILFSTKMVQALLAGNKTMTRRIVKNIPEGISDKHLKIMVNGHHALHGSIRPYCKKGDLLWVRETWSKNTGSFFTGDEQTIVFAADIDEYERWRYRFKPSIHLKKADARIWLQVVSITVERLNDISETDAVKEGVKLSDSGNFWFNYLADAARITNAIHNLKSAKSSLKTLWKLINGRESWDLNPWVWVVEFKLVSRAGEANIKLESEVEYAA